MKRLYPPCAQIIQRAVEVLGAVFEGFISRAAELGEIAGARNPIMAARVDDETVIAAVRQSLSDRRQRRQIEIHRHAVDEQEREVRFALGRREQQAVQRLFVAGFET